MINRMNVMLKKKNLNFQKNIMLSSVSTHKKNIWFNERSCNLNGISKMPKSYAWKNYHHILSVYLTILLKVKFNLHFFVILFFCKVNVKC